MVEKVELFKKRSLIYFLFFTLFIFFLSTLFEYHNYTKMLEFNTYSSDAKVISQTLKYKKNKPYYILKIKLDNSAIAYIRESSEIRDLVGRSISVTLFIKELNFFSFIRGTYYNSYVSKVHRELTMQKQVSNLITSLHPNKNIGSLYSALYTASPLSKELRATISKFGISHLVAISGYHLSLLGLFLFFILKFPYIFFQKKYFPYRNRNRDIFFISATIIFSYAYFLDFTPSVLRSFSMLIIGYVLYDRGIKVISMQTLFLTMILLITFFPKLLFSIGFWLSLSGVFYIVLFLKQFEKLPIIAQFVLLHVWVYITMLPLALYIFGQFSIYHPFSILLTMLFNIFYPLSLLAHLCGCVTVFDSLLEMLLTLHVEVLYYKPSHFMMLGYLSVSLLAVRYKLAFYTLLLYLILFFFIK